jgi:selenocysteine-specific elongation factor
MVGAAAGARSTLVVISAPDGIAAQTREHMHIAEMLGVTAGVIAVSKCDRIDAAQHSTCLDAIRKGLANTAFADAPMILCSALTGAGLDALVSALGTLFARGGDRAVPLHSFLPIDRAFTVEGRGTVVTGTLSGRDMNPDDDLILMPAALPVSLRGVQTRGMDVAVAQTGARMAANLRGTSVAQITRGAVVCAKGAFAPTTCMDITVEVAADAALPLKHNTDVRVLFGTTAEVASVRLYGGGHCTAGDAAFAQLRFKKPVTGFAGQRAVLRRLSPAQTLGGAVILDPVARPARSNDAQKLAVLRAVQAQDTRAIAAALARLSGGSFSLRTLARLARLEGAAARSALGDTVEQIGPDLLAARGDIEAAETEILRIVALFHADHPLRVAAPRAAITLGGICPVVLHTSEAELVKSGVLRGDAVQIALATHDPVALLNAEQKQRIAQIEATFLAARLSPPANVGAGSIDADLSALLVSQHRLVPLENIALKRTVMLHRNTLRDAVAQLSSSFPAPQEFTTSQARLALECTRRIIVPVLEYFDANSITARQGDLRRMTPRFEVPPDDPC